MTSAIFKTTKKRTLKKFCVSIGNARPRAVLLCKSLFPGAKLMLKIIFNTFQSFSPIQYNWHVLKSIERYWKVLRTYWKRPVSAFTEKMKLNVFSMFSSNLPLGLFSVYMHGWKLLSKRNKSVGKNYDKDTDKYWRHTKRYLTTLKISKIFWVFCSFVLNRSRSFGNPSTIVWLLWFFSLLFITR